MDIIRKSSLIMSKYISYKLADVELNTSKELFTVVTTFAGGGGSSTGYKLAGGKILVANEFIPTAVETYKLNYPNTPVVEIDIRKITGKGGAEKIQKFFEQYNVYYRELDIFDGSPPCTTFSTATAGRGFDKIEKKNVKHSDTTQSRIGMLVHDYVYLVNCLQPKVCLIENVVPSKNSVVFKHAMERLRRHGYILGWKSVFATDCGAGQKRERLITIGIRPDVAKVVGIKTFEDILKLYPQQNLDPVTLRDVLSDIEVNPIERDVLLRNCRLNSSYEVLKLLPKNPPKPTKIINVDPSWKKRNSDFSLVRASWNTPSPTMTCRGQQMGISGVHHPDEDRKFTIDELKRITSLPDDFKLTGTFNQKAERIGNMVPPMLTRTLATSIYENVIKKYNESLNH